MHSKYITSKHEKALKDITNERYKYEDLEGYIKECLQKMHLINVCNVTTVTSQDLQMTEVILEALKKGKSFCLLLTTCSLTPKMKENYIFFCFFLQWSFGVIKL